MCLLATALRAVIYCDDSEGRPQGWLQISLFVFHDFAALRDEKIARFLAE
jgi:hypothetical protein